jgi:hypothetical protein
MIIGRIQGFTRVLGKSQGYIGLPLLDTEVHDTVTGPGTPAMQTASEPTPAEIAAINQGQPIILTVLGTAHPPVMLTVGDDWQAPTSEPSP